MAKISIKKLQNNFVYKEGFTDALLYIKEALREVTDEEKEDLSDYLLRMKYELIIDLAMSVANMEEKE